MAERAGAISANSLHQRLALAGPEDELTRLGWTFDDLLGRLETSFDAQRRFSAHVSHELRTPLALSRALLEVAVTDPVADTASLRAACREVMAVGEQQERLIEALLMLARSERGLDRCSRVDLAALGDEVVTPRRSVAENAGIELHTDFQPAIIDGDRRLIERLIVNLVDNAIGHNHRGGLVAVSATTADGHPILTVTNTGPPVAERDLPRLLQPFERLVPEASRRDEDGLGLGLSIVAAVAKTHRANLALLPQPSGGLVVSVRFPRALEPRNDTVSFTRVTRFGVEWPRRVAE